MPERSPDRLPAAPRNEETRDIRLPPLPDRPTPAVPPGWASFLPAGAASAGAPAASAPAPDTPAGATPVSDVPAADAATAEAPAAVPAQGDSVLKRSVEAPTDRVGSPSDPARQHTTSFAPRPSVELLKVSVTPRRSRTTSVLWALVLLTLAVIVASGIYLLVTVQQR